MVIEGMLNKDTFVRVRYTPETQLLEAHPHIMMRIETLENAQYPLKGQGGRIYEGNYRETEEGVQAVMEYLLEEVTKVEGMTPSTPRPEDQGIVF